MKTHHHQKQDLTQKPARRSPVKPLLVALALGVGTSCVPETPGRAENAADAPAAPAPSGAVVLGWNETALEVAQQSDAKYLDPFVHLRALAMMHLSMHDAVNAVTPKYERHAALGADPEADAEVAAAAAAHGVLRALYPEQASVVDGKLEQVVGARASTPAGRRGLELGKAAARANLEARRADGWDASEPYVPRSEPGRYQFVPPFDFVYRPAWRNLKPFGLERPDQFRSAPPPPLSSEAYAKAYREVVEYGRADSSSRSADQTAYADHWYELSELGWNRIARITWSNQESRDLWFTARLFALLNVGLMDAYVAGWDSKLHYDFWRPYTAIRLADADDNPTTVPEPRWESYCVNPPVQDYPSTHSALGAAAATVLRDVYGRDVPFVMASPSAKPAGTTRSLASFEAAAIENADSRVACGIHFRFATDAGLELGRRVGDHVLDTLLEPVGDAG